MSEDNGQFRTVPAGDDSLRVSSESLNDLRRFGRHLRRNNVFEEVVDGIETLTIQFDPAQFSIETASSRTAELADTLDLEAEKGTRTQILEVVFGGETGVDLHRVAEHAGLSPDELIAQICDLDLEVDMLGFTPGFAYLKGVPSSLDIPRLDTPRQKVEAGSLGIAAGRLGTYALEGPGGWPIIGKVQTTLFDKSKNNPFLLTTGDKVRLTTVSET